MNDFKIPQFTFISIPEQDEFVRQKEAEFRNATGMNHLIPGRQETKMMKLDFKQSSNIHVRKVMIPYFCFLDQKVLEKHILDLQLFGKLTALLFQLKK